MGWIILSYIAVILLQVGHSQGNVNSVKRNESQLIKDLFAHYDPLVSPNRNNSPDWKVDVTFFLNSLNKFDEKEQVLSFSAGFGLFWDEPLLKWNAEDYETTVIYVPSEMLWTPDIIIANTIGKFGTIGSDKLKINVNHNGSVMWMPGDFYKIYCKFRVRHYPFDSQVCKIKLDTWSCPEKIVNLDYRNKTGNMNYETNAEWELTRIKSGKVFETYLQHYSVEFTLFLRRKTLFYVVNMILPIMFLSLLNSLTFALPAHCGEKVTLCISVLLSYAVFLTLVNDALPENSEGICFFSTYLALQVFLSAAATIVTVVILSIHHRVPGYMKVGRCVQWMLPTSGGNKVQDIVWAVKTEKQVDVDDVAKNKEVLTVDVAAALDKMCFRIFFAINILVTVFFFGAMLQSGE